MEATDRSTTRLRVALISTSDTLELRHAVLRPGFPIGDCEFPGDDAPTTLHVGALLDDEIVAVGSLYLEARPVDAPGGAPRTADHDAGTAWRLRGMATSPKVRRRGAGAATLRAMHEHAQHHGGSLLWCNARLGAVRFYEAQGWQVLGTEFEIPSVGPHLVMERRLG